jgi:hypothetical protein
MPPHQAALLRLPCSQPLRGEGWRLEKPLGTGTVPAGRGRGQYWLLKCPSLLIALWEEVNHCYLQYNDFVGVCFQSPSESRKTGLPRYFE